MTTERERKLLDERNQILERLAKLDLERAALEARLTIIELELGL